MSLSSDKLLDALAYEDGPSGPFCPYCTNARKEWEADRAAFDIFDHVKRCLARKTDESYDRYARGWIGPTVAEMTGSDPDFTGDESTADYIRRIRE